MTILDIIRQNFPEVTERQLDFVNIDFERDTPLFLDPFMISLDKSELTVKQSESITIFFEKLLSYITQNNPIQAKKHLKPANELKDLCLGFSRDSTNGNGIGDQLGSDMIDSIIDSEAMRTGQIDDLADMHIFIKNVGKDRLSDMVGNILKRFLIEYTQNQCDLWQIPTRDFLTSNIWNSEQRKWDLPSFEKRLVVKVLSHKRNGEDVYENRSILLCPRNFVSRETVLNPQRFYKQGILDYYQQERLLLHPTFKKRDLPKYEIEEEHKRDGLIIDKEYLSTFRSDHDDIFVQFKADSEKKIKQYDIKEDIGETVDALTSVLQATPHGFSDAYHYESLILGISKLLFDSSLFYPRIQVRLNSGRQRVDIVYSNRATKGVFHRIPTVYNILANQIMVECKNKVFLDNSDIQQIEQRFSDTRGKVGMIFCRKYDETFFSRVQDAFQDHHNIIIPIDDITIIKLLELYKSDDKKYDFEDIISKIVDDIMTR